MKLKTIAGVLFLSQNMASASIEVARSEIAQVRIHAEKVKEQHSLDHVEELIGYLEAFRFYIGNLGADIDQIAMGILDSDMGKLEHYWTTNFFETSIRSDRLITFLQAKGDDVAVKVLREVFDEAGFRSAALLSPTLSIAEVRQIFHEHPILKGYFHEIVGISSAIEALDQGKISAKQFRTRLVSNLFHNGPNSGFWQILSQHLVPSSLGQGTKKAQHIFSYTVFESKGVRTEMVIPHYPSPLGFEGSLHTIFDRLSQGSAIGMLKIFEELGNNPKNTYEMLIRSPLDTIKQIDTLMNHINNIYLPTEQRSFLTKLASFARERLVTQTTYLSERVKLVEGSDFRLNILDPEGKQVDVITAHTDSIVAKNWIKVLTDDFIAHSGRQMNHCAFSLYQQNQ